MDWQKSAFFALATCGMLSALPLDRETTRLRDEVADVQAQLDQMKTSIPDDEQGAVLAPASPFVDGDRYSLGMEYIYWNARVDGTEFAYSNNAVSFNVPIQGSIAQVNPDWSSGFKILGGRYFTYDRWSLLGSFTYFRPTGSNAIAATSGSARIPTRGVLTSSMYVDKAKADYSLDYFDIDGDLGRSFYVTGQVSLRPFFGLKTLWFNQRLTTRYTGGAALGLDTVTLIDTSNMWGLGPQGGLSSEWNLGLGVKLFVSGRVALPYTYVDSITNESRSRITTDRFYLREQKHQFSPLLQGRMAFGWSGYVNERKQFIDVSLGYDFSYFMKYSEFLSVMDVGSRRVQLTDGDVSMQGLGLRLNVSF